jgi:enoyl-CoA hydratase/carnithine racemase
VLDLLSVQQAGALLTRARSGGAGDEYGVAVERPLVAVNLDQPVIGEELQPPIGWPCVLAATSSSPMAPTAPPGPDVFISAAADPPPPWIGTGGSATKACLALHRAVMRNPQASTTLVQVIRLTATVATSAALLVESLAYSTLQGGPEHARWLDAQPVREADRRAEPVLRLERSANALWVTLDRPERRNAYSARMRDELVAALEVAATDPTLTSVHLAGRGSNFCAGGDLAEFGTRSDPSTAHGIRLQRSAGWWIHQLRPRVTAHLHGACVGAGVELSAFAGKVEAAPSTTLMLPEVSMGLIPGAGGTASITARIGAPRTAWLALTGDRIDAEMAARWGLVDHVVRQAQDR